MRRSRLLAAAATAALVAGACSSATSKAKAPRHARPSTSSRAAAPGGGSSAGGPCGAISSPPTKYRHVIWIWMENHAYSSVIGSPDAPFQTDLANKCASATSVSVVGAPSLPNYIGATSGQTFGIHDDADPATHPVVADNVFRQVRATGGTARSYEESMPTNCALTSAGQYAVRHNPAAYYAGPDDRAACARDNVPLGTTSAGALIDDLRADTLPTFAFITPNVCNDSHDCPVSTGDAWLRDWVPRIVSSPAYARGDTAVVIWYDEYTPVPNALLAPAVRRGTRFTTPTDQYALLRTTEELLGLTDFLGGAASAPSFRTAFNL